MREKDVTWSDDPSLVHYRIPAPLYGYHKAIEGTVERFRGCVSRLFPEFPKMMDEDLEELRR